MNIYHEVSTDNQSITGTVPDLVSNDTFVIQMEYTYKNVTEIFKFYVEAEANVEFENNAGVSIKDISASEKAYVITLAAGTSHLVGDIFINSNLFAIDTKVTSIMISDGTNEYAAVLRKTGEGASAKLEVVSSDTFGLSDVNAEFDGTNIKYGSKIYTIYLTIGAKAEKLKLNYKLYIEIIPTYLINL